MSYDFLKKKFFWSDDFLKKIFFWSDPPPPPPGGYFKEFWLIFDILGFKWYKMGQKIKNFVTKKLQLD